MSQQIYIDGAWVSREDAKVSIFDHGLLYGDGVFDSVRSYDGRLFKLDEHVNRLYLSAKGIGLDIGIPKAKFTEQVIESIRRNNLRDAYVRLVVTRGPGDLGIDPRKCTKSTIIILADKITIYPEETYKRGLRVIIASTRRTPPDSLNGKIKSLNYLNNIIAKLEHIHTGMDESLMLNHEGYLVEGTVENIFLVKGKKLLTPPCHIGALEGITRQTTIDLAPSVGLSAEEALLTANDLYTADECFLTGTGAELVPVVQVDGRAIGDGKPGPVTQKMLAAYREYTKQVGIPI